MSLYAIKGKDGELRDLDGDKEGSTWSFNADTRHSLAKQIQQHDFPGGQFQPMLRYGGTQVVIESIADMADYSSVIGNIYENPELLGASDEQA